MGLLLNQFNYELPQELIAQFPLKNRNDARLLVIDREKGSWIHDQFCNLENHVPSGTHFVCNNSKVVPARLIGKKIDGTAKIEVFLLEKLSSRRYKVLLKPMKRLKEGDQIFFEEAGIRAELVIREERIIEFSRDLTEKDLDEIGHMPLPPYIKRDDVGSDRADYQTVYAKHSGSVAAPTAGLHFTQEQIKVLKTRGNYFDEVTLHINYGTFKPVETENILDHKMHTEKYFVRDDAWQRILKSRDEKRPILAVGTTSCRVLESIAVKKNLEDQTNLFIYPGYSFRMTDYLLTNFHLPQSTLLMLVYTFGSTELMKRAYQEAIQEKYRFYSYGDAMLIK